MPKGEFGFKKGQSGNPGGRKRETVNGYHIPTLAKEHGPDAIKALAEIMKDTDAPPAARVKAADVLLDRGFGKAPAVIHNINHGSAREMSDAELIAFITAAQQSDSNFVTEKQQPVAETQH